MPTNWESITTQRVGRQLRKSRKELKLSAQGLADRTSELGHPIGRATITDLETGRRQSVTVAELLILAAALKISPVALLYADQFADGEVEMLPGMTTTAAHAALWSTGDEPLHERGDVGEAQTAWDLVRGRHASEATVPMIAEWTKELAPHTLSARLRAYEQQREWMQNAMRELGLIVANHALSDDGGTDAGVD